MAKRGGWLRLLPAVAALAALAACADTQANMTVTVQEYSLAVEPNSADEGNILIDVDNLGSEEHELVLVRGNDPAALPLTEAGSVDVEQLFVVDRVEPFPPGRFRIMSPDVRFGTYILFCSLVTPGPDGEAVSHFQRGMHTLVHVAQLDPVEDDDVVVEGG